MDKYTELRQENARLRKELERYKARDCDFIKKNLWLEIERPRWSHINDLYLLAMSKRKLREQVRYWRDRRCPVNVQRRFAHLRARVEALTRANRRLKAGLRDVLGSRALDVLIKETT